MSGEAATPRRMFVALPIPAAVRAAVQAAIDALPVADGLRWVRPEAWHLTLVFLGAVRPEQLDDLTTRLGRAAARAAPIELQIDGAGRFGRQILWAGVTGDGSALRRLAQSTSAAGRRAGIAVDDRPYRAHLTLARSSGADPRPVADALHDLRTPAWTATGVQLIESRLGAGPGGSAQYEVVERWALSAARSLEPESSSSGPERLSG